jgi:hypothetical protein
MYAGLTMKDHFHITLFAKGFIITIFKEDKVKKNMESGMGKMGEERPKAIRYDMKMTMIRNSMSIQYDTI